VGGLTIGVAGAVYGTRFESHGVVGGHISAEGTGESSFCLASEV
jgi:hypothetical protein